MTRPLFQDSGGFDASLDPQGDTSSVCVYVLITVIITTSNPNQTHLNMLIKVFKI